MVRPQADSTKLLITLLLWFFFGGLGIHRFYLGHTATGIVMLAMTVVGFATACILIGYIPLIAVAIWAFIDLILIVTGALAPTDGSRLI